MVDLTRRTFLKGTAAVGAGVAASDFLFGGLDTVSKSSKLLLAQQLNEDYVHTTCWIGKQDCGIRARRVDGRVIKLEGMPGHPRNDGTLCPKGQAQIISFYDNHRVKTPLRRVNAKGQPGEFERISWDEALELVANEIKRVREEDPKLVLWQKGRSKAKDFYDDAFVKALGCEKLGHGAYCSDTGYRAVEYTVGLHGVLHPDLKNSRYVLSWGWNITNAGGNKFCWITWPQQLVQARENNGLKIVQIDPRLRPAGPFADQWVPIRPATDLAFALALNHELIAQGFLDRPYLTTYSNAPWLVGPDGLFLRDADGRGLVWDEAAGRAVAHEEAQSPALEGAYTVDGVEAKTAFELFKEHVAQYTPEWAAPITGIEADQIRRIATDYGTHAQIGATVVVDGVEIPYRPVGIMAYHMAQQELGFQALRAMSMLAMLVGAWGAVGGQTADFTWKVHKNYAAFEDLTPEEGPYSYTLKHSKFFPINSGFPGALTQVMKDPAKYEVEKLPKVMILHHVNPIVSFASQKDFLEAYEKFEFVAAISPWMSETADYFADVVLPCPTIEKYEGPISATDGYIDAVTLRMPPMEPLFESRSEIEIYMDICERVGVLNGEGGYLEVVNKELKLTDTEFAIPLDGKPTPRQIFDQWAKAQGVDGVSYFEQNGVLVKGPLSPTKRYGYVADPPFGGALHRLYGESLLKAQRAQQQLGAPEVYWRDYTPLPTWREPTMWNVPDEYEFTLISYKLVEHKQSRTTTVPLLAELSGPQRIDINPKTARRLGIEDGDTVVVESYHAITGETRRLTTTARLIEGIRPDVVGMPHHFGKWSHPSSKGLGPTPNEIFFTDEGYSGQTADASFHVRVRVTKE